MMTYRQFITIWPNSSKSMTFEEFLKKKKIDPGQLKTAERDLFQTFESDFNQMGDRSFEYSKKFWFNKLRRAHPLKEEPKPVKTEETSSAGIIEQSPRSAESISEVSGTATPKPAFKPRFKAQIPSAKIEETTAGDESPKPTPAFKPRFRAPAPVVKEEEEKEEKEAEELNPEPVTKPTGFKPRFKASVTPSAVKPESAENKEDSAETSKTQVKEDQTEKTTDKVEPKPDQEAIAKPAYKPRFKPSMLKKDSEE